MSSQAKEYEPLCEEGDLSSMASCHASQSFPSRSTLPDKRNAIIFSTLLLLSNLITGYLSIRLSHRSFELETVARSPYGMFPTESKRSSHLANLFSKPTWHALFR